MCRMVIDGSHKKYSVKQRIQMETINLTYSDKVYETF